MASSPNWIQELTCQVYFKARYLEIMARQMAVLYVIWDHEATQTLSFFSSVGVAVSGWRDATVKGRSTSLEVGEQVRQE